MERVIYSDAIFLKQGSNQISKKDSSKTDRIHSFCFELLIFISKNFDNRIGSYMYVKSVFNLL